MSTKRQKGLLTYIDVPEAAGEKHWVWKRRDARLELGWDGVTVMHSCPVCNLPIWSEGATAEFAHGIEVPVHAGCAP